MQSDIAMRQAMSVGSTTHSASMSGMPCAFIVDA